MIFGLYGTAIAEMVRGCADSARSVWSASACPALYTHFQSRRDLSPPAQGCEERATLGVERGCSSNPERVVASRRSGWNPGTTLSGLARASRPFPRVARSSQPWALGRNPFGILPGFPDSKDGCKEQGLPTLSNSR